MKSSNKQSWVHDACQGLGSEKTRFLNSFERYSEHKANGWAAMYSERDLFERVRLY